MKKIEKLQKKHGLIFNFFFQIGKGLNYIQKHQMTKNSKVEGGKLTCDETVRNDGNRSKSFPKRVG